LSNILKKFKLNKIIKIVGLIFVFGFFCRLSLFAYTDGDEATIKSHDIGGCTTTITVDNVDYVESWSEMPSEIIPDTNSDYMVGFTIFYDDLVGWYFDRNYFSVELSMWLNGAYDSGYLDGYNNGVSATMVSAFKEGFNIGFNDGMADGYSRGYDYAESYYLNEIDNLNETYLDNIELAKAQAYQKGLAEGYALGSPSTLVFGDLLGTLAGTLFGVLFTILSFELFGIPIGFVFFATAILSVGLWLFKVLGFN